MNRNLIILPIVIFIALITTNCTSDDTWAEPLKGKQTVRKMKGGTLGSPISGSFFLGIGSISGGGAEPSVTFFWELKPKSFVATSIPLSIVTVRLVEGLKAPTIQFIFYEHTLSLKLYRQLKFLVKETKSTGMLFNGFTSEIKHLIIETAPEHWPIQISLPLNR